MTRDLLGEFIDIVWFVFWAYWLISAATSKKTAHRNMVGWYMRLMIVLVIIIAVFESGNASKFVTAPLATSVGGFIVGAFLVVIGLAFAVWARVHLGKNWGMPMSLKENPELVTSGPYRLVRHPIYSGVLLAMLGSAIVGGVFWLLVVVLFGIYFIYSGRQEEKIMTKEFPDQYPEYMKRSKMLIPWVL